jgi:hypothetical protein
MLHRLADGDGDGRVSEAEYSRFLLKFHAVGYRKKFIAEFVLALFDVSDDGYIYTLDRANNCLCWCTRRTEGQAWQSYFS